MSAYSMCSAHVPFLHALRDPILSLSNHRVSLSPVEKPPVSSPPHSLLRSLSCPFTQLLPFPLWFLSGPFTSNYKATAKNKSCLKFPGFFETLLAEALLFSFLLVTIVDLRECPHCSDVTVAGAERR